MQLATSQNNCRCGFQAPVDDMKEGFQLERHLQAAYSMQWLPQLQPEQLEQCPRNFSAYQEECTKEEITKLIFVVPR